jgi:hypothetical protein
MLKNFFVRNPGFFWIPEHIFFKKSCYKMVKKKFGLTSSPRQQSLAFKELKSKSIKIFKKSDKINTKN